MLYHPIGFPPIFSALSASLREIYMGCYWVKGLKINRSSRDNAEERFCQIGYGLEFADFSSRLFQMLIYELAEVFPGRKVFARAQLLARFTRANENRSGIRLGRNDPPVAFQLFDPALGGVLRLVRRHFKYIIRPPKFHRPYPKKLL